MESGVTQELTLEFRLLGEEALTNVVKYADAEAIEVTLDVSETSVVLEVRDDGRHFDPLRAATPELDASVEDRPLGGLGIHLIQTLTDEVSYERRQQWNVLQLTKNR
jgi:anti-sigma regulatory factor (Ser/Thr protein kinase)